MKKKLVQVSAPVGSFASLSAAFQAKADMVYFGIHPLHMRARSSHHFTLRDLPKIVARCQQENVQSLLVLNTILYDQDLPLMRTICQAAKEADITAIVASDLAAICYARSIGLSVQASTQLNICNMELVRFLAKYVDVCILARELTLSQISAICQKIKKENIRGPSQELMQIELFAHGALCVAIAGKCHMSLAQYNLSANRGECLQACRRQYRLIDEQSGDALSIDNEYILSPKDLCTLDILNNIVEAGVSILKIEGRGRTAEYVYTVVKTYKEALQAIEENNFSSEKVHLWKEEVKKVYNRGFWENGYYLGHPLGEWSGSAGSLSTEKKVFVGHIAHYFDKAKVAEALIQSGSLQEKDPILIMGNTTGVLRATVESLRFHSSCEKPLLRITFPLTTKVRKNDQIYLLQKR